MHSSVCCVRLQPGALRVQHSRLAHPGALSWCDSASCPRTLPRAPQSQKQQLRSQLDVASKARENARTSMKELRSSVKFTKGEANGLLHRGNRRWVRRLGCGVVEGPELVLPPLGCCLHCRRSGPSP